MRSLTRFSVRSARVSNNLSRSFLSRQLAHRNHILILTFCLSVGLALLNSFSFATNTLGSRLPFSEAQSLDQKLATQFPTLAASLAVQPIEFEMTRRIVGGREVTGLTARTAKAKGPGDALGVQATQKPAEHEALRLTAERDVARSEFKTFFPEQYTESFAVEGAGVSAVLRPLEASPVPATVENGKVIYRGAYRETDSLHVLGASRSEEFLYLHSKNAPRRFEYELSSIKGARAVKVEGGAVRFEGESGRGLQIEAPWVVDASGERREDVVRWELGVAAENGKRGLSLVVVEGAELSYPLVIDPSWSTTGSLATARFLHTATLLQNGKVLVVGGSDSSGIALASGELYDPATGTWTATGSLAVGRWNHTATLLPNGKILVAGGENGQVVFASAELYDPATGTWAATGSLTSTRVFHTATLLLNGKVLVAGGAGGTCCPAPNLASAELYNPATSTGLLPALLLRCAATTQRHSCPMDKSSWLVEGAAAAAALSRVRNCMTRRRAPGLLPTFPHRLALNTPRHSWRMEK